MTAYKVNYEYKPSPVDIDWQNDPYYFTPFKGETIVWAENISEAFNKTILGIHVNAARYLRQTNTAILEKLPYPIKKEIVISKLQLEVAYLNVIV
jgi:asparagine synthetase A